MNQILQVLIKRIKVKFLISKISDWKLTREQCQLQPNQRLVVKSTLTGNLLLVFLTVVQTLAPVLRIAIKIMFRISKWHQIVIILSKFAYTNNILYTTGTILKLIHSNDKSYCCPCLVAKDVADHIGDNGTAWCFMYLLGLTCTFWVSILSNCYNFACFSSFTEHSIYGNTVLIHLSHFDTVNIVTVNTRILLSNTLC